LFGIRVLRQRQKRNARVSFGCIAGIWEAGLDFWT
jgi:hypothetical protein